MLPEFKLIKIDKLIKFKNANISMIFEKENKKNKKK